MRIAYRLGQLWANLSAGPLTDLARAEVAEVLNTTEQKLFDRFSRADQWHSYRVLRCLRDAGYNHPDLLVASLLHDIGKIRSPLSVWDRTVIVVGGAFFPERAEEWGRGDPDSWRRPFVARARHPEWGAEMATAAGSRPAVVDIIRRHQDKHGAVHDELDQLLAYLQWADDQN